MANRGCFMARELSNKPDRAEGALDGRRGWGTILALGLVLELGAAGAACAGAGPGPDAQDPCRGDTPVEDPYLACMDGCMLCGQKDYGPCLAVCQHADEEPGLRLRTDQDGGLRYLKQTDWGKVGAHDWRARWDAGSDAGADAARGAAPADAVLAADAELGGS